MDEKKMREVSEAMEMAIDEWGSDNTSSELDASFNWRGPMKEMMKRGDVGGMAEVMAPKLQAELIELALSKETPPPTKFAALTNLLAQAGHAPTHKVAHVVDYNLMDVGQLQAVLQSRLRSLAKNLPGFDVRKVLPSDVVECEFEEGVDSEQ